MDTTHEPRIMKADPRARVVLAVCAAILLLGAALATLLIPRGQNYLQGQEPRVTLRVLQGLTAFMFLSVLPISGYMFWFGRRAVRSRQMPPPGTWLIRDTRVIEGDRAVRRGQGLTAIAVILAVIALFAGTWLPYKFGKVFADNPRQSAGQTDSNQPAASPAP